jgi:hypothetical protein
MPTAPMLRIQQREQHAEEPLDMLFVSRDDKVG